MSNPPEHQKVWLIPLGKFFEPPSMVKLLRNSRRSTFLFHSSSFTCSLKCHGAIHLVNQDAVATLKGLYILLIVMLTFPYYFNDYARTSSVHKYIFSILHFLSLLSFKFTTVLMTVPDLSPTRLAIVWRWCPPRNSTTAFWHLILRYLTGSVFGVSVLWPLIFWQSWFLN